MLLLLHGAVGDPAQFDDLRLRLNDTDTHALGFEGHGARAMAGRPFRLEHFVENVREWLDAHPDARVDLFGHSMGGYVALLVAAAAPDRVRSVFTLGTKLVWSPDIARGITTQLDPAMISAKVPRFAEMLARRHVAAGWERVVEETAGAFHALGAAPLLTPEVFATITCPVRLAVGDRDEIVPVEELRDTVRLLPRGEYEVLPATPHPFERVSLDRVVWSLEQFGAAVPV